MFSALRTLRALPLTLLICALGCHAQLPVGPGKPVPADVAWRIETLLRTSAQLPPGTLIHIGGRTASELPGYDQVPVTFEVDGQTTPSTNFLISTDNKTLAQFNKYDMSQDPKQKVSDGGRPSRGGATDAPVTVIIFDDLECPYCARMQASLFPGMLQRYGKDVHVVYYDYPLKEIHPWAMRAAVDVNCLATQNTPGYWNLVDYLHGHITELPADEKSIEKTNDDLDRFTREEGQRQKVDMAKLNACIAKQDTAAVDALRRLGDSLKVSATPTLFINGDRIDGALPADFVYKIIDTALLAQGKTPPPAVEAPAPVPAANPHPGH